MEVSAVASLCSVVAPGPPGKGGAAGVVTVGSQTARPAAGEGAGPQALWEEGGSPISPAEARPSS